MGKYRYDNEGDWHGLYAMAFMDSNNRVQPIMGYGFEKCGIPVEIERVFAWGRALP